MRKIILTLTAILAVASSVAAVAFAGGSASAATASHPTVVKPNSGYGDWIDSIGRHNGRVRFEIETLPEGRALFVNAHTAHPIHYRAILGTGAERRVMNGWVGGHGPRSALRDPHMDVFVGLRPRENYRTIRVFQIP